MLTSRNSLFQSLILLALLGLTACSAAPAAAPEVTASPAPTATSVPTITPTPEPTATPTLPELADLYAQGQAPYPANLTPDQQIAFDAALAERMQEPEVIEKLTAQLRKMDVWPDFNEQQLFLIRDELNRRAQSYPPAFPSLDQPGKIQVDIPDSIADAFMAKYAAEISGRGYMVPNGKGGDGDARNTVLLPEDFFKRYPEALEELKATQRDVWALARLAKSETGQATGQLEYFDPEQDKWVSISGSEKFAGADWHTPITYDNLPAALAAGKLKMPLAKIGPGTLEEFMESLGTQLLPMVLWPISPDGPLRLPTHPASSGSGAIGGVDFALVRRIPTHAGESIYWLQKVVVGKLNPVGLFRFLVSGSSRNMIAFGTDLIKPEINRGQHPMIKPNTVYYVAVYENPGSSLSSKNKIYFQQAESALNLVPVAETYPLLTSDDPTEFLDNDLLVVSLPDHGDVIIVGFSNN